MKLDWKNNLRHRVILEKIRIEEIKAADKTNKTKKNEKD